MEQPSTSAAAAAAATAAAIVKEAEEERQTFLVDEFLKDSKICLCAYEYGRGRIKKLNDIQCIADLGVSDEYYEENAPSLCLAGSFPSWHQFKTSNWADIDLWVGTWTVFEFLMDKARALHQISNPGEEFQSVDFTYADIPLRTFRKSKLNVILRQFGGEQKHSSNKLISFPSSSIDFGKFVTKHFRHLITSCFFASHPIQGKKSLVCLQARGVFLMSAIPPPPEDCLEEEWKKMFPWKHAARGLADDFGSPSPLQQQCYQFVDFLRRETQAAIEYKQRQKRLREEEAATGASVAAAVVQRGRKRRRYRGEISSSGGEEEEEETVLQLRLRLLLEQKKKKKEEEDSHQS